jgi:undecaprenyl-diphosphatase
VTGYAVIAWFLRYLSNNSFAIFVGYRLLLGSGVLILTAAGLIST